MPMIRPIMAAASLGILLRPGSGTPLYQQLFDQIAERVRSGAWPAGYRLPATRALAHQLGTHRNTVVRAYEELVAAGFLESAVGRGTFVAARREAVAVQHADRGARGPRRCGGGRHRQRVDHRGGPAPAQRRRRGQGQNWRKANTTTPQPTNETTLFWCWQSWCSSCKID